MYKFSNPDCLSMPLITSPSIYDRDSRPLKSKLFQPYIVYQDPTKNAMVIYMCFDSRYFGDFVAVGLNIPDWA